MLRLDRACIWILMFGMIMFIPSIIHITFLDELYVTAFLVIAVVDSIFNRNWAKYKFLWIVASIITLYAIYSATLNYNTVRYIFTDWLIEIKPFAAFAVFLAIAPKLTDHDKHILSKICFANILIMILTLLGGESVINVMVYHPMYCGLIIFVSSLFYLYCRMDKNGKVTKRDIQFILVALTFGLLCEKAKYYGAYVVSLYFFLIYKPGISRHLSVKHIVAILIVCAGVLMVSWARIQYYFISGDGTSFDPKVVESFARPVLYITGWQILFDHFPFGTGLASFASAASTMNYSNVYYEYGIHTVWGLLPDNPAFACDTFYPSLAQFGVVGIGLFIWFWVYVYSYLRVLIRINPQRYKLIFTLGSLIIISILIESTTATTFTHNSGMLMMCLLGIICGVYGDNLKNKLKNDKKEESRKRTLLAKI